MAYYPYNYPAASDAIKAARVFLNDTNGITWTDAILMPILQQAYGELTMELERHQVSAINLQTPPVLVGKGLTYYNLPGMQLPIALMEGAVGDDIENFIPMTRCTFLPALDITNELMYWSWGGSGGIIGPYNGVQILSPLGTEVIQFLGATTDRLIIIRYKGFPNTPVLLTDPLVFSQCERFLGPRIAGIAYDSVSKDGSKYNTLADNNLHKVIQTNITNDQIPTRHRAYRSSTKFLGNGPAGTLGSV